mmetsp:Transcript_134092/g.428466  ORF Transcript_134092/g.428466 Transcript_134092/m.428466 type:complete len:246 (-) Transcript_134092:655-1392(-)
MPPSSGTSWTPASGPSTGNGACASTSTQRQRPRLPRPRCTRTSTSAKAHGGAVSSRWPGAGACRPTVSSGRRPSSSRAQASRWWSAIATAFVGRTPGGCQKTAATTSTCGSGLPAVDRRYLWVGPMPVQAKPRGRFQMSRSGVSTSSSCGPRRRWWLRVTTARSSRFCPPSTRPWTTCCTWKLTWTCCQPSTEIARRTRIGPWCPASRSTRVSTAVLRDAAPTGLCANHPRLMGLRRGCMGRSSP